MTWVVSITRILMNMVKFDCLLMSQISTGCYPSVEPNRIVTICKCLNIMTLRVIKIDQKVMIYLFFYSVHYLITKRKLKQWWSSIPPQQKCQKYCFINVWRESVFDIYFTEFGTALTTILPILFQYRYKYCYSDSRNLWAVMQAGGVVL
jgi:hypothetical protein